MSKISKLFTLFSVLFSIHLFSQNLLTNGDFESGGAGVGFAVPNYNLYNPGSGGTQPGNYIVSNNPTPLNNFFIPNIMDHSPGAGNNMLVVDASTTTNASFWSAVNNTTGLCGLDIGATYTFSYWVRTISSTTINIATQPDIIVNFTGATGTLITGSTRVGLPSQTWQQVLYSFVPTSTCVRINLVNSNTSGAGNDFAVDDIKVTLQKCLLPIFTQVAPICAGDALTPLPTTSNNGIVGSWSPALDNTMTSTYTFTPTPFAGPNLILNGDFSLGNTNFTTDYLYQPVANTIAKEYTVVANPTTWNNGFAACQGNGGANNFMVVNGSTVTNDRLWCQTVTVNPGETYQLSYFSQTLFSPSPARLEVQINGVSVGMNTLPAATCNWVNSSFSWNSGTNTTATICFYNRNIDLFGNDFSIDDISFMLQCADPIDMTIAVNPLPQVTGLTAVANAICTNDTATFNLIGTANATVSYTLNGGGTQNVVLNATGNATITVNSATIDQTIVLSSISLGTCMKALTNTLTITVGSPQVTSLAAAVNPICSNDTAIFNIVGTPNATVSYALNGGATQTVVLDTMGNGSVSVTSPTINPVIVLSSVSLGTCMRTLNNTSTITVSPSAQVTNLTSVASPICTNDTATFNIIGTANATVSYTLNGGAVQTVVLNATGNGTVTVASATADQVIVLSSVSLGTCMTPLTNTSTITVSPSPQVTNLTSVASPICTNDTATFNLVGTPNATVSYILNGTTTQTVILNATGNGTVSVASATVNQVIVLSSVSLGTCMTPLTNTSTITVSPLPQVTNLVAAVNPICTNDTATFNLVGTPNATVSYTLNGGATQTVVLNATGNGTVTVASATANQTIVLSSVSIGTCMTPLTNTSTITVSPLPQVTNLTSVASPICTNDTATFNIIGTANATVSYTLNGGTTQTVVLNATGNGTVSVASAAVNQVIVLSSVSLGTCMTPLTNTLTITVSPLPQVTNLAAAVNPICSNDTAIFNLVGTANATVSYTLNGGATQTVVLNATGNGTVSVASATANQTIVLSSVSIGTCMTPLTNTSTITVSLLPQVTNLTSVASPICTNDTATFNLLGTPNATVSYTLNGGTTQTVVLNATGNGTVSVASATANQVIVLSSVSLGTCMTPLTNTLTITVSPLPQVTNLAAAVNPICTNDTATFNLVGTANATVSYTLNGGATLTTVLDATGNGTVSVASATVNQVIVLSSVSLGTCMTPLTNTLTITVSPLPQVTNLTSVASPICTNDTATFNLVGTANATVSYTLNGGATLTTVLDATGNGTVSVASATVNQVIVLPSVSLGTCMTPLTNTLTITVSPLPQVTNLTSVASPICTNDTATFNIVGTANATVSYTLNGGATLTTVLDATGNGTVTVASATVNQVIVLSSVSLGTCMTPLTNTSTITVSPLPQVTNLTSVASPICTNDTATFNIVGTASATVSYTLNGAVQTVVLNATGNGTVTVASATANQVIVLSSVSLGTCMTPLTNTLTITVNALVSPEFIALTPICEGEIAPILQTISPTGINGTWSPPTVSNTVSADYTFTPNPGQCARPQVVSMQINKPTLTSIICVVGEPFSGNRTITVYASSEGFYEYQLDDGTPQNENIFQNVEPGTHTITVSDVNGCSASITKQVLILDYPKFFTPNNDSYNDYWNIIGLKDQPDAKIYIFDRFGKLLKQISSQSPGWDGNYNGEQLPSTDYWFTVDFVDINDNSSDQFKAHFSLKR
jgi:gliding motility-associated-like protein